MKPDAPAAGIADIIAAQMRVGRPELMPISKKWLEAKAFVHLRDMRRDPVLSSCLELKCYMPTQNGWQVEPFDESEGAKTVADFVERAFKAMEGEGVFAVVDKLLDAVAIGFSVQEKVWGTLDTGELYIRTTVAHDPQNISFSIDNHWNVHEIRVSVHGKGDRVPYPRNRFIYWTYNPSYEHPYGHGDFSEAYRAWYSKNQAYIFWTRYLERMARGGIAIVKYAQGVTPELQEGIDDQLNLEGSLGSVHLPDKVADFKLEQALNSDAGRAFLDFVRMQNEEMAKAILGSSLMTDEGSRVGSKAMAAVHAQTAQIGSKQLARMIETQINKQVIEPIVRANYPGVKEFPTIKLPQPSLEERAARAEILYALLDRNVISPDEPFVRSDLNIPKDDRSPEDRAEVDADQTLAKIIDGIEAQEKPGINIVDAEPKEPKGKEFAEIKERLDGLASQIGSRPQQSPPVAEPVKFEITDRRQILKKLRIVRDERGFMNEIIEEEQTPNAQ